MGGFFAYPAPNANYLSVAGWNGQGIPPIDDPLSDFYTWWNLLNLNPYSAGTAGIDLRQTFPGENPMPGSMGGQWGGWGWTPPEFQSPIMPAGWQYPSGGTIMDDITLAAMAAAGVIAADEGGSSQPSQPSQTSSEGGQTSSGESKTTQPSQTTGGSTVGSSVLLPGQGPGNTWGLPTSGFDWSKVLATLGTTGGAAALAALLSGGTGGSAIAPYTQTPMYPGIQKNFGDWLLGQFKTDESGKVTGISGATAYPGQVNVDLSQTLLPALWSAWTPNNQASQGLSNLMSVIQPVQVNQMLQNMLTQGGVQGQATDIMSQLARTGLGYGVGSRSLANIFDYGAPSASSAGMVTASQKGYSSEQSGKPLSDRAYGLATTPAAQYLARFLSMSPSAAAYTIPSIQQQPVGRK